MPEYQVSCYCDCDLVHAAYAVTGWIELADQGEIELVFRSRPPGVRGVRGPFTVWFDVEHRDGWRQRVVCDTHDGSRYRCGVSLAGCDVYYKVNYRAADLTDLPAERVRPFGPLTPMRPRRDRSLWSRWWGNLRAHAYCKLTANRGLRGMLRAVTWESIRHRRYVGRGCWTELDVPPTDAPPPPGVAWVFYNPTCWDETGDNERRVNEFRAEVVRLMRKRLGSRFAGGLRTSAVAKARYVDALEERPYSYRDYMDALRGTPIAVYTNGLQGCFSWRLVEALATGRCIVSERIENDAGFPLDESAGIVQCATPQLMVDTVQQLIDTPDRMATLARASRRAWVERLRPAERMRALLHELSVRPTAASSSGRAPIRTPPVAQGLSA